MTECQANGKSDAERINSLNKSCICMPINRTDVDRSLVNSNPVPGLNKLLAARPHLFAGTSVFLSNEDLSDMYLQIEALNAASKSAAFRGARLNHEISDLNSAQSDTLGVMMGYDFHVTSDGPKLIEVNTNAGGAFLVAALQESAGIAQSPEIQKRLTATFISEWRRARSSAMPRTIAIVDETPHDQYLYPDMLLAQQWFEIAGIETFITDPAELTLESGKLRYGAHIVDMVYNRVTDFSLSTPRHEVLRSTLLSDAAVISPAPRHHALHANKLNLAFLTEPENHRLLGLPKHHMDALSKIPVTQEVTCENADILWANRRGLFFKPACGFASRAAYRGSKLTRRVWDEILKGEYVAQEFVKPTHRVVGMDDGAAELKYDVRVYAYDGEPLLLAARVYQGQTTNFRSPGGGFAPIITSHALTC